MQEIVSDLPLESAVAQRTATLFQESQNNIHKRADHLFANLMLAQWLAGIAAAWWISPKTWIGASSQTHWHIWAAIFLGGAITSFPVFLAWRQPGRSLTRHTIAVAQMLTSALLIHLTGGRIETHFHVFGSLAFLAFYGIGGVLMTATVVVAADHMARGIVLAPIGLRRVDGQSVALDRTRRLGHLLKHVPAHLHPAKFEGNARCRHAARETGGDQRGNRTAGRRTHRRTHHHQRNPAGRNCRAESRRGRLRRSEAQLAAAQIIARIGSWEWDVPSNKMIWSDENYRDRGFEPRKFEVNYEATLQFIHPDERAISDLTIKRALQEGKPFSFEQRVIRLDGTERIIHQRGDVVLGPDGSAAKMFGTAQDVTERKRAEEELENVHKQLLDTSRQAGMAEVATGVLHNVGNVLNSMNVSASLAQGVLRRSKTASLVRTACLLQEHSADLGAFLTGDPKGRLVPGFIIKLAHLLDGEHQELLKELSLLAKNVEHIKEIVAMQQTYARVSGVVETVIVSDLVEDALRMNASALARHEVETIREFAEMPPISTEKHKVLQILVNLIRNAKYACDESGRPDKRLIMRSVIGDGRVKISITDNGVGIPPENLTRIFGHGFTTKKDGHGFGLHSGANAAKEMGGQLTVHSDGPGRGAIFTLELPIVIPP